MKKTYGTILVLSTVTLVFLTASPACLAAEEKEEKIWRDEGPRHRGGQFELTNEAIERMMERLKETHPERAEELANDIRTRLEEILKRSQYDSIFINLGRTYKIALEKCKSILCKHKVCRASGKIGERLHQLKNWLAEIDMEREEDI